MIEQTASISPVMEKPEGDNLTGATIHPDPEL